MIWLSLHPSPASETSAFSRIRAFSSRCAGLFPFRIKLSNCSRSSALSRTTYLFTDFARVAIVPSVAPTMTEANHQILSNWLKRATSWFGYHYYQNGTKRHSGITTDAARRESEHRQRWPGGYLQIAAGPR